MKHWICFVFISFLITPCFLCLAFDIKENLHAKYDTQQKGDESDSDISIYWHEVPTWPKDETRQTDDPQFSSDRGGLISYTTLIPGQIIFGVMPAISAEHLPKGELKVKFILNYSSFYQMHEENGYVLKVDGEVGEASTLIEEQITDSIQAALFARSFYFQAGRADKPLDEFHDFLGLPTGPRGTGIYNQYSNEFSKDGQILQEVKKNQLGLGDAMFLLKLKALDETKQLPVVSIILALKTPTGNEQLGYTVGSWDPGVAVAFSKQLTRDLKAHMTIGAVHPGQNDHFDNLTTTYSSMNALEYYLNKRFSLVFQSNFSTSPFADYPFKAVSGYSWTVGVGGHVRLPNNIQIHFHFTDELGNLWDTDWVFGIAVDCRSLIDPLVAHDR